MAAGLQVGRRNVHVFECSPSSLVICSKLDSRKTADFLEFNSN